MHTRTVDIGFPIRFAAGVPCFEQSATLASNTVSCFVHDTFSRQRILFDSVSSFQVRALIMRVEDVNLVAYLLPTTWFAEDRWQLFRYTG
jgi:hypothetical protein